MYRNDYRNAIYHTILIILQSKNITANNAMHWVVNLYVFRLGVT